jgi:SAM-dependent methyltransferase
MLGGHEGSAARMTSTVHADLRDRRGEYGFDGSLPGAVGMGAFGVALVIAGIVLAQANHGWGAGLALAGLAPLLTVAVYVHTTRRGKLAVWAEVIEDLRLSGDEQVLDVGCGRGAVLTMVAKRLRGGRVVGIDVWSTADQWGNGPEAARRNVEVEGVKERCELVTGDMRAMPFADASFDVVVSSIAIHNVLDREGRRRAIEEIVRVLRPGGRVVIADLSWTRTYARQLREHGLSEVERRGLGWRFWWGLGIPATCLVTARKAAAEALP